MLDLRPSQISMRTPHRIATTTTTNELAQAVNLLSAPVLGVPEPQMFLRPPGLVWIHNSTGYELHAYSIVGIGTTLPVAPATDLDQFLDMPHVDGVDPTTDHVGKFAITQEEIPIGGNGFALVTGVSVCQLSVTAEADKYADVAANDRDKLVTGSSGFARILAKESGTGTKWGVVRLSGGEGGTPGFFPVLVVWSAGSDGDAANYATWTYLIYALADTSHLAALAASAAQPENSPARIVKGPVIKAPVDSIGQAYTATDGTVHLYTCAEKHGSCT
jgi:hypothetical protein